MKLSSACLRWDRTIEPIDVFSRVIAREQEESSWMRTVWMKCDHDLWPSVRPEPPTYLSDLLWLTRCTSASEDT